MGSQTVNMDAPAPGGNAQGLFPTVVQGSKTRILIAFFISCVILTCSLEVTNVVKNEVHQRNELVNKTEICTLTRQIRLSKSYRLNLCIYAKKSNKVHKIWVHIPTSRGIWLADNFQDVIKAFRQLASTL